MNFDFEKFKQLKANPDLSNLTPTELEQLKKVFDKQEKFEKEIANSMSGLKKTINLLEQDKKPFISNNIPIKNGPDSSNKSSISLTPPTTLKSCFICKRPTTSLSNDTLISQVSKNKTFQCYDCLRLVCEKCGCMASASFLDERGNTTKSVNSKENMKWKCKICIVKMEVAKKSVQNSSVNNQENEDKLKKKDDENSIKKYFEYFPSIQKSLNLFGSSNSISFSNINNKIKSVLGESNSNINKENSSPPENTQKIPKNKMEYSNMHSNFDLNIISATPQSSIKNLYCSTYFNGSDNEEFFNDFNSPDSSLNINLNSLPLSQRSASPCNDFSRLYTKSLSPSILQQALNRDQYLGQNSQFLSTLNTEYSRMASPSSDICMHSPSYTQPEAPRIMLSSKNFNKMQETGFLEQSIGKEGAINIDNTNEKECNSVQSNEEFKYMNNKLHLDIKKVDDGKLAENQVLTKTDSIENLSSPPAIYQNNENRHSFIRPDKPSENNTKADSTKLALETSPTKKAFMHNSTIVKPKPSKFYFKRANSLFVGTHAFKEKAEQFESIDQDNNEEEDVPELIIQPNAHIKIPKGRSHSNEITVNTRDLNDFIRQQSNNDYDGDENLTNLAKVILIEHKRSLQMTSTQDSSISFTPTESASRRDSFSSRQDSSVSVTESEIIRQASRKTQLENQKMKNALRSSKEWQRRKLTMKKTKKWSNSNLNDTQNDDGDDNLENLDDENSSLEANQSLVSNESLANMSPTYQRTVFTQRTLSTSSSNQFSSSYDYESRPAKKKLEIENKESNESLHRSSVSIHIPPEPPHKQLSINNKCKIQSVSSDSHKNFSVSFFEEQKQPSTTTDESNESNSSENNKNTKFSEKNHKSSNSNISKNNNILTPRPSRKLPEIPLQNRSSTINLTKNLSLRHELVTKSNESIGINDSRQSVSPSLSLKNENVMSNGKKRRLRTFSGKIDGKKSTSSSKSSQSNFSKTIDSADSFKCSKKDNNKNFHSVDLDKTFNKKDLFFLSERNSPQRSIDYPCIIRRPPKLSDIVRKRLLFKKVSRGITQLGETFSSSIEKEHVPKVPRKIIIRQDNSIELGLTKPPKLRVQTASLDLNVYGQFSESINTVNDSTQNAKHPSMLSVSSSNSDRRKTIETCENIFLQSEESTKLRAKTPPSNPHRILLYKDQSNKSIRMNGLGMRIVGGHECEDGSLGCFVTLVVKGGPADANNIEVGDQILVFNGHSLIDATYEELRNHQNNCGDYVQLVVQHNNVRNSNHSPLENSRQFETVPRLSQSMSRKRRNLPPLPSLAIKKPNEDTVNFEEDKKKNSEYIITETLQVPIFGNLLKPILINRGRLLMQIWDNSKLSKLAITINQANNLPFKGESRYTFISGRVIFDEQGAKLFETLSVPLESNSNPIWNETFVFDCMNEQIEDIHLEICLYESKNEEDRKLNDDNFIGMLILPLSEANLEDEPRWYELRDKPTRKSSTASVTFKSSEGSLESLNEKNKGSKKENKGRKFSLLSLASRKSSLQPNDYPGNGLKINRSSQRTKSPVGKISRALSRLLSFRRSSESGIKHTIIRFDDNDDMEEKNSLDEQPKLAIQRKSNNELTPSNNLIIISNASSRKSSNISNIDIGEDIDRYFNDEEICKINDPKPGPGQVPPKSEYSNKIDEIIAGNIKLGFLMSKGQLEITIFEARNLNKLINFVKEDTYIKTYLRTGTNKLHKKKTHIVKNTPDPVYNVKLCYKACNVLGRRIQVVALCQKTLKLENLIIGEAFVELDALDLSKSTIGWYKLYKQNCVDENFYDST